MILMEESTNRIMEHMESSEIDPCTSGALSSDKGDITKQKNKLISR